MQPYFDHERLEVYRLARQFNRELQPVLRAARRGAAESKDNLVRGGKSITRNIAEGAGRWSVPDKVHFYHIARASATECAASLDELVDYELVAEALTLIPKATLARIVSMLIAMIRSVESSGRKNMSRPANPRSASSNETTIRVAHELNPHDTG